MQNRQAALDPPGSAARTPAHCPSQSQSSAHLLVPATFQQKWIRKDCDSKQAGRSGQLHAHITLPNQHTGQPVVYEVTGFLILTGASATIGNRRDKAPVSSDADWPSMCAKSSSTPWGQEVCQGQRDTSCPVSPHSCRCCWFQRPPPLPCQKNSTRRAGAGGAGSSHQYNQDTRLAQD